MLRSLRAAIFVSSDVPLKARQRDHVWGVLELTTKTYISVA